MKVLILLLFVLVSVSASSQSYQRNEESGVAVSLSGGYATNKLLTGNFSIGAQLRDEWIYGQNHISANLQVFSDLSKGGTPVIFEGRLGHVFNNSIEIYGGYGYHRTKSDAAFSKSVINDAGDIRIDRFKSGFKPAYGIIKRFSNSLWAVSAGMSGNIFSLQLGILAVR